MTRGQLRDLISFEAKIKDADLFQSYINEAINRVYFDLVKELKLPEFLIRNTTLSLVGLTANDVVALPNEFLFEDRIRFFDSSGATTHRLVTQDDHIPPAPLFGLPKVYKIVFFTASIYGITAEPKTLVDEAVDKIRIDYFRKPVRLELDTDSPASSKLDEEIVKRVVHILLSRDGKINEGREIISHAMKPPGPPVAVIEPSTAETKTR